jgi:hypothetical protein
MEMTGGMVWKDNVLSTTYTRQKKTMTSQIHVPDASVRPTTLARKTEKDSLQ